MSHMKVGDFRSNEKSMTMAAATDAKIEFVGQDGKTTVLKPKVRYRRINHRCHVLSRRPCAVLEEQIEDAKKQGVLFSIHMKATMMKVSDPKIFGHAVTVYTKMCSRSMARPSKGWA